MQDSLLWVYEGQTQFWGYVLGARSGMLSKEDTLDAIAATAATYSTGTPGPRVAAAGRHDQRPDHRRPPPQPWRSWQRSEDYYSEGQLIWIDVDRIIRQQSGGQALDRRFRQGLLRHARPRLGRAHLHARRRRRDAEHGPALRLARLSAAPGLRRRRRQPPLEGITQGGYKLVYTAEPTKWSRAREKAGKNTDLTYSGGFVGRQRRQDVERAVGQRRVQRAA